MFTDRLKQKPSPVLRDGRGLPAVPPWLGSLCSLKLEGDECPSKNKTRRCRRRVLFKSQPHSIRVRANEADTLCPDNGSNSGAGYSDGHSTFHLAAPRAIQRLPLGRTSTNRLLSVPWYGALTLPLRSLLEKSISFVYIKIKRTCQINVILMTKSDNFYLDSVEYTFYNRNMEA